MANQVFNIKSPFFPGFYSGPFDVSEIEYDVVESELDYYRTEEGIDLDTEDLEVNWESYTGAIIDKWVDVIRGYMPKSMVQDIEFTGLWSPKDYNPWRNGGHTDEINLNVTMTPDWKAAVKKFMDSHHEALAARIKEDWTSYDGFISFMDNDIDDWYQHIEDEDERYIECIITYAMWFEYEESGYGFANNVREAIIDEVADISYEAAMEALEMSDAAKEKLAAAQERKRVEEFDKKHQLSLDFPEA